MLRPVLLALGLAFAAAACSAAPASAALVSFTGGGLTITGSPGEGSRLTVEADANTRATVHDDADGLQPGRAASARYARSSARCCSRRAAIPAPPRSTSATPATR